MTFSTEPAERQGPSEHHRSAALRPRRHPIFVLSPARSYSSITVALMAGHPDIYALPEMLLFSASSVGGLLRERERRQHMLPSRLRARQSGILRAIAEIKYGDQSDRSIGFAKGWLEQRSVWSTTGLMDELLRSVYPLRVIEKSPDTVQTDSALHSCIQAYPEAHYIHLTRHPITAQTSMHECWRNGFRTRRELIDHCADNWYSCHSRIVAALSTVPHHRWMRLRGEDLLGNPVPALERILAWLGLPAGEEVIAGMLHTERWVFAGMGHDGKLHGADKKFLDAPQLRTVAEPGPVEFDPFWGLSEKVRAQMAELASGLGY